MYFTSLLFQQILPFLVKSLLIILFKYNDDDDDDDNNNNNNVSPRLGNTGLISSGGKSHLMGRGILFSLGWQSF